MTIGDYPKEYDPSAHGQYDPARYYGKPDTPFGDVKLSELAAWLARRKKTPSAVLGACSRAWWRWQHKYMQPRKVGAAPFLQLIVGSIAFFYVINYGKIKHHRNYKYH
ncbi:Putative ATP synthase subunit f, mitochondrial [Eumeta japonica]|uniref:ATP synthase subunit f, mitochondrial n=1 Tax=Eumeta variegata TaxID=151549 RepID=A0A4C1YX41_EUMVA|nr:Putative ATP synthase subunit f, mitochondrial [Eumeta japonica]